MNQNPYYQVIEIYIELLHRLGLKRITVYQVTPSDFFMPKDAT